MNSYILLSQDAKKHDEYLHLFCEKHAIGKFDKTHISQEGSIGVEIIRKLQETLFLKPLQSKEKILVIEHAENLTPEAQNALLKTLEEPPANTFLFLLATSDTNFLPTILSRCSIVQLDTTKTSELAEEERETFEKQFHMLTQGGIGERLSLAENLAKEKKDTRVWLEKMIVYVREKLLADPHNQELALLIEKLHQAHTTITTTNVSVRVVLEHYFLLRIS